MTRFLSSAAMALLACITIGALCAPLTAKAQTNTEKLPFLTTLFTDNMVLQRDQVDPIWGWTKPGAAVTVTIQGKTLRTLAGQDGKWMVKVGPFGLGDPFEIHISGPQNIVLHNVVTGDVWMCTGQSNMEFGIVGLLDKDKVIADANNPGIRLWTAPYHASSKVCQVANGHWSACTPTTILEQGSAGGFSAPGYLFGKELNEKLHIPIGLIECCIGATNARTWTSAESLSTMADFHDEIEQRKLPSFAGYDSDLEVESWYQANDPGSANGYSYGSPTLDTSSWTTMKAPGNTLQTAYPKFHGVIWFRKTVDLNAAQAASDAVIQLGKIAVYDRTWVNGVSVGGEFGPGKPREYGIPAGVLKSGPNVIAVRNLVTFAVGGLSGPAEMMNLVFKNAGAVSLTGDWLYSVTNSTYDKGPQFPQELNRNVPAYLYNGMVAPLVGFGIKGVIWHQNAGIPDQYRILLPTLIKTWRDGWGEGSFPFYIVQHESWKARSPEPLDACPDAQMREVQRLTSHKIANSGLVVTYDIGDVENAHPKDKVDLAHRLALVALAKTYGQDIEYSGPDFTYADFSPPGKMTLHFSHIGKGLAAAAVTKVAGADPIAAGKLVGFQIADADHKWVWADADIIGDTVVVGSPSVPDPKAVRYAWAMNPAANLFNIDGLPAPGFRTDGPPSITGNQK